jgi:type II secretory pathway pseudopilin PulG
MGKLCKINTMKRKTKAFTLVELLLVAAILSYALSAILATFTNTLAFNEMSRNLTTATTHAEHILENVRNTTFSNVSTNISSGTWNWNATTITSNGLTALNSESISTSSSGTNPLTVTVTVSWNDLQGRSRSKALQTIISG